MNRAGGCILRYRWFVTRQRHNLMSMKPRRAHAPAGRGAACLPLFLILGGRSERRCYQRYGQAVRDSITTARCERARRVRARFAPRHRFVTPLLRTRRRTVRGLPATAPSAIGIIDQGMRKRRACYPAMSWLHISLTSCAILLLRDMVTRYVARLRWGRTVIPPHRVGHGGCAVSVGARPSLTARCCGGEHASSLSGCAPSLRCANLHAAFCHYAANVPPPYGINCGAFTYRALHPLLLERCLWRSGLLVKGRAASNTCRRGSPQSGFW